MLHRFIATSAVLLMLSSVLGGCLGTEHLSTRTPSSVHQEISGLREDAPRYTRHVVAPGKPEIFALVVEDRFSLYERAQILRAVSEWNVALNGFIRFEIMSAKSLRTMQAAEYWIISPKPGRGAPGSSTILATTSSAPDVGGLMAIYVDRIGRRDLGGIVMHELGHVLGLGHSGKAGLMAAHYHLTSQRCVDRTAVEALAARRKLPLARLNWCAES